MTIWQIAGFTIGIIWTPGTLIGGYILALAVRARRAQTVAARKEWDAEGRVLAEAELIIEGAARDIMREAGWG